MNSAEAGAIDFAERVLDGTSPAGQTVLLAWLETLAAIRLRDAPLYRKSLDAMATLNRETIWPAVNVLAGQIRYVSWDDRSTGERWGVAAAVGLLILTGNAVPAVMALAWAIGIPIWIVLGAGKLAVDTLREALKAEIASAADADE